MKQATLAALVVLAALAVTTSPASAALRSPQVAVDNAPTNLQPQINILNTGAIDVTAEQQDLQRWSKNVSGTGTFTFSFELGGNPTDNEIGIYNAVHDDGIDVQASDRFVLFPSNAEQGWYATATFTLPSTMNVKLFDALDQLQDDDTYNTVNVQDFSFYIKNGDVVGYGQDVANPDNQARALVFGGTDENEGGWFLCFEDGRDAGSGEDQDFDEAILFLESIRPVPAKRSTWASVKSLYR